MRVPPACFREWTTERNGAACGVRFLVAGLAIAVEEKLRRAGIGSSID
jgi:hypothetical protein